MKSHAVSSHISRQDLAAVDTSLKALRRAMPFLVTLAPKERRRRELRIRKLALAEHALEGVRENRAFLPPYFDFEQFEHDVQVTRSLHTTLRDLKQLVFDLQATLAVTGSDVANGCEAVCAHLKAAAKTTAGLKAVTQQLAAVRRSSSSGRLMSATPLKSFTAVEAGPEVPGAAAKGNNRNAA